MGYYVYLDGTRQGPYTFEELKNKGINRDTLVWKEGLTDWVPAQNLPELSDLMANTPPTPYQVMPKTWLAESILVTLFCCLPFGIVGIVNSSKVSTLFSEGRFAEAREASKNAGIWTKRAFVIGLVLLILYVLFYVIAIAIATDY